MKFLRVRNGRNDLGIFLISLLQFIYEVITLNSFTTTDLSIDNNLKAFHFQKEAWHFLYKMGPFTFFKIRARVWTPGPRSCVPADDPLDIFLIDSDHTVVIANVLYSQPFFKGR